MIEVMNRPLQGWWSPRYGAIYRTPAAAIFGPKVMIINEFAGSGGDMMPWMFHHTKIGTLVGKRTWGGLVGVGAYPPLMDGGNVTAPSFGFFNPEGQWDVENKGVTPDVEVELDPKAGARRPRPATGARRGAGDAADEGASGAGAASAAVPQLQPPGECGDGDRRGREPVGRTRGRQFDGSQRRAPFYRPPSIFFTRSPRDSISASRARRAAA